MIEEGGGSTNAIVLRQIGERVKKNEFVFMKKAAN